MNRCTLNIIMFKKVHIDRPPGYCMGHEKIPKMNFRFFTCYYTLLLVSRPTPLIESAGVRYAFTYSKLFLPNNLLFSIQDKFMPISNCLSCADLETETFLVSFLCASSGLTIDSSALRLRYRAETKSRSPSQYKDGISVYTDFYYSGEIFQDRLIFIMGIPILTRRQIDTDTISWRKEAHSFP